MKNRKIDAEWTTEKRLRHGRVMRAALALRKARIKEYDKKPGALLRYVPASTFKVVTQPEKETAGPENERSKRIVTRSMDTEKEVQSRNKSEYVMATEKTGWT